MRSLVETVARTSNTSVLIMGETGTGKELVANSIHYLSSRRYGPFIKLNCSAIPDTLMESELFGYEKGAFTDARQSKKGLFELADGGTIFLDEIGDMDLRLQPKLLQILENRTLRKLGGVADMKIDVRVIAATNVDLSEMVRAKRFREDLYYRLNVMAINLPPLRERREDIVALAEHFINENKDFEGEEGQVKKLCKESRIRAHELRLARQHKGAQEHHREGHDTRRAGRDKARAPADLRGSRPLPRQKRSARQGIRWICPLTTLKRPI